MGRDVPPKRGRRRDGGCLLSWRGSTLSVVGLGRTSGSLRGVGVDPRHLSAAVADGHKFDLPRVDHHGTVGRQGGHGELRPGGSALASRDASSTRATPTPNLAWSLGDGPTHTSQGHVKRLPLVVSRDDDADRMRAAAGGASRTLRSDSHPRA